VKVSRATPHDRIRRGGFKAGEESEAVADHDEEEDRGGEGHVRLVSVADDGLALIADELVDDLGDVLDGARLVDAEGEAGDDKEEQEQQHDQELEGQRVVAQGGVRVRKVDAQPGEERDQRRGKVVVQQSREREDKTQHKSCNAKIFGSGANEPYGLDGEGYDCQTQTCDKSVRRTARTF
jgi:hypothetical protein